MGIWLSAAASVLFLALLDLQLTRATYITAESPLSLTLRLLGLSAALGLALSAISIPRRPMVYKDNHPVERHLTAPALSRITYAWAGDLLRAAKTKNDLEMTDFAVLDHHSRSVGLSAAWKALPCQPRLWRALVRAYRSELGQQWVLAVIKGVMNYAPHFFLLKFLEVVEKGYVDGSWPLEAWFLVFALVFSMLVDGVSEAVGQIEKGEEANGC